MSDKDKTISDKLKAAKENIKKEATPTKEVEISEGNEYKLEGLDLGNPKGDETIEIPSGDAAKDLIKESQSPQEALNHLAKIESYLLDNFKGKQGHNPFIYINQTINPIRTEAKRNGWTPELINAALSLPSRPNCEVEVSEDKTLMQR